MADTLIDGYSESNSSSESWLCAGVTTGVGQCFVGSGIPLTKCKFYLGKYQSPTGYAVVKIYNMIGTFGVNGIANGYEDPVAVSTNSVDVSTLPAYPNHVLTDFTFDGSFTPEDGSHYVASVEYFDGDGGNFLRVGQDDSSPTHPGNYCFRPVASMQYYWSPSSSSDLCFYAYGQDPVIQLAGDISGSTSLSGDSHGSVSISGSMPSSSSIAGDVKGSVRIEGDAVSSTLMSGDIFGSVSISGDARSVSSMIGEFFTLDVRSINWLKVFVRLPHENRTIRWNKWR